MSEGPGTSTVKMPMPDQIIAGRYRIISRLGSGGMGLVFLAEQLGVGNRVALKFLDPEPSTDETRATRFLREAKVALQVQHPGATQILDLGRDEEQRLFMCFELVEGEDLREVIKKEGRLRFGEARAIAVQVAQVLAFAHDRHIVHRDVKPENLRVRRDLGTTSVKVLDFGIARLLKDTGLRLTGEGMLAGTPRYMAPEQVKDEEIDGRIDQYALGLVFFEMLTGAVAIGGKNITQILMHQIQTVVAPLGWVDAQLANPAIDSFIARACAKDPRDRFPSMADFILALQSLQVDERAWPEPKAPPAAPGDTRAPTREAPSPQKTPRPGESDTLVRVPARTEQERRLEVITEPDREPVKRRTQGEPERTTKPLPGPPQKKAHPALELPTDPERPMVSRQKATVPSRKEKALSPRLTVRPGEPQAPAPKKSRTGLVIGLVLAVLGAGAAAAAWWFTHH